MRLFLSSIIATLLTSTSAMAIDYEQLIKLGTAYHAKNMCTCLYVLEQTMEFCKDMTKTKPNISELGGRYIFNEEQKTVTVTATKFTAVAKHQGEQLGCVLKPTRVRQAQ